MDEKKLQNVLKIIRSIVPMGSMAYEIIEDGGERKFLEDAIRQLKEATRQSEALLSGDYMELEKAEKYRKAGFSEDTVNSILETQAEGRELRETLDGIGKK